MRERERERKVCIGCVKSKCVFEKCVHVLEKCVCVFEKCVCMSLKRMYIFMGVWVWGGWEGGLKHCILGVGNVCVYVCVSLFVFVSVYVHV